MTNYCLFTRNLRLDDNLVLRAAKDNIVPVLLRPKMNKFQDVLYDSCCAALDLKLQAKGSRLYSFDVPVGSKIFMMWDFDRTLANRLRKDYEVVEIIDFMLTETQPSYVMYTAYARHLGAVRVSHAEVKFKAAHMPVWGHGDPTLANNLLSKALRKARTGGQTGISPLINFGFVSCRKLWRYHELRKELIWRDFYYALYLRNPEQLKVVGNGGNIPWKDTAGPWLKASTGVPLVDRALMMLRETGLMPNRLRMIVACYLIKELKADWKIGEKFFREHLLDYDLVLNNANWQWVAGTLPGSKMRWGVKFSLPIQTRKYGYLVGL